VLARALGWPWQLEPATLGLALLLPLVVAWIATSIPAWNAARVDPVAALRFEE
jgi:ABC-type lipoprotein release transport system permease subunit